MYIFRQFFFVVFYSTHPEYKWRCVFPVATGVCRRSVGQVKVLRKEAERERTETLLSLGGELSSSNCYLELQAGAGGTESHDWTSILYKMYTQWAETRGFTCELSVFSPGSVLIYAFRFFLL